jgi:hypothetical protein
MVVQQDVYPLRWQPPVNASVRRQMTNMRVQPTDSLNGSPALAKASVLDFWRWAFSDLSDDDIKGFFAKWLVHKLLGVPSERRVSWANSDLITARGIRIEVKSTAYWQSWKYLGEDGLPLPQPKHLPAENDSKIRFSGLKARDSTAPDSTNTKEFKSHLYIFAFQHEKSLDKWNALDLTQWEFFLVPVQALRALRWGSISLPTLRHRFGALTAEDLASRGRAAIAALEAER